MGMACFVWWTYTLYQTDLLEAVTVGQRNEGMRDSSAIAIMTTLTLGFFFVLCADCDN